jgi:hypothetical protein
MAKTAADQFAEILAAAGVKRIIYGIVGDSLNGITDAIRRLARSSGSTSDMKKSPPLRRVPKRI